MNNKWIPIDDIYELSWRNTLKELSLDGDNLEYMSQSLEEAIDFDRVARHYEKKWKLNGARPSSADALIAMEHRLVLVEFKNGTLGVPEIRSVRKKIRDSILVFCDLTDSNMRYTREYMDFILVYNQEKTAKSKTKHHFSKKAGKELVLFGLGIYQGSHFATVRTLTGEEFDAYLAQSLAVKQNVSQSPVPQVLEEKQSTQLEASTGKKAVVSKKAEPSTGKKVVASKKAEPSIGKKAVAQKKAEASTGKKAVAGKKIEPSTEKKAVASKKAEPSTGKKAVANKKAEPSTGKKAVANKKAEASKENRQKQGGTTGKKVGHTGNPDGKGHKPTGKTGGIT